MLFYYSRLSAPKYAWLNIGEGEGTFQWEQVWEERMSDIFEKIREKRFLFQRFVTIIVASLGEMSVKKSFSPPHLHSFLKLLCRVPRNH